MKPIIIFKWIDVVIQPLTFFVLARLWGHEWNMMEAFYFGVGSAQFTSGLLNRLFLSRHYRSQTRIAYELILLALTALTFISYATHFQAGLGVVFIILVYVSPLLAIWYYVITIHEAIFVTKWHLGNKHLQDR